MAVGASAGRTRAGGSSEERNAQAGYSLSVRASRIGAAKLGRIDVGERPCSRRASERTRFNHLHDRFRNPRLHIFFLQQVNPSEKSAAIIPSFSWLRALINTTKHLQIASYDYCLRRTTYAAAIHVSELVGAFAYADFEPTGATAYFSTTSGTTSHAIRKPHLGLKNFHGNRADFRDAAAVHPFRIVRRTEAAAAVEGNHASFAAGRFQFLANHFVGRLLN